MWRASDRRWAWLTGIAFLLLGTTWAFASPQGSATDEEFHLTTTWCAWGEWSGCAIDDTVVRADGSTRARVVPYYSVPDYIANINCYFYGDQSAACLAERTTNPVETRRFNVEHNPDLYYVVMRTLASEDAPRSVQLMRLANVLLASALLTWALLVARPAVARGLTLAWGLAAIPLVVFYISSTNPSAWALAGMGTFWAFALTAASAGITRRRRIVAVSGALVAAGLALAARYDSLVWIALSLLVVGVLRLPRPRTSRHWIAIAAVTGVSLVVAVLAVAANLNRLLLGDFGIPGGTTSSDQPNPVVRLVLELPSYLASMFGAQRPVWVQGENAVRATLEGYTPIGLAQSLGDSYFASAVGYLLGGAALSAVIIAVGHYRRRTTIAMVGLVVFLPLVMILIRGIAGFGPQSVQPRYLLPWLLITLGIGLTVWTRGAPLLRRGQAVVLGILVAAGGSLAWLVLASRYAVGQDAAFTNFGQEPEWWWSWGPSRLVWFAIAVVVTGLWAAATVGRAALDGRQAPPGRRVRGRGPGGRVGSVGVRRVLE